MESISHSESCLMKTFKLNLNINYIFEDFYKIITSCQVQTQNPMKETEASIKNLILISSTEVSMINDLVVLLKKNNHFISDLKHDL